MSELVFANNASSLLAVSISAVDLSVQVASGEGALFPSPSGGDYFKLALIDADGNIEICHCTARSSDLLTVVRGQESTTARAFTNGVSRAELRITKATMEAMLQTNGDTVLPVATGGTGASSASGARTNLGLGTMAVVNSPVPVANGGTAANTEAGARTNLGLGTMAVVNSPVPVANGGTASTTAAGARTALGLGTMAVVDSPVPVANGGTASTTAAAARTALGAAAASHTHSLSEITDEGSFASKNLTVSTSSPSGTPADGDIWAKYTP